MRMIATLLVRSILFSLSSVRSNLLYTDASGGGGNPPSDDEDHGGHDEPPRRNNPQQVRISGAHGPRLNDYDAATKAVLHLAIEQLHVRLADENAWPDTMEKGTWARLCWDEAESTLGADMNPNIDVLKIVSYSLSYMPAITLLCFSPRFLIEIRHSVATLRAVPRCLLNQGMAFKLAQPSQ